METKKEDTTMEDLRAAVKMFGYCKKPCGAKYRKAMEIAYLILNSLANQYKSKAICPFNPDSHAVEDAVMDTISRLHKSQLKDKTFADRLNKATVYNIFRSVADAKNQHVCNGVRVAVLQEADLEVDETGYATEGIDAAVSDIASPEKELVEKDLQVTFDREIKNLEQCSPELYVVIKESQQGLGDKTFKEIGEKYGYSDQTASNRFKAGVESLRRGFSLC